ncbi:MAG: efflux RND transporter permease subunit, partial [Synergistaceae bacterium]
MFAQIFIKRPKLAFVISILLTLAGFVCIFGLPIEQYPDITPPQVQVTANYRGASAQVVANTVGAPIEEIVNGVDGMIYMDSTSGNDGSYELAITFATGTDPDMALVKVQNRIQQATPKLPSEVTAEGITVESRFSSSLGFVGLLSPKGTHSELELTDYAHSNVKNQLKRIRGMGDVQVFGTKYSVRIWLDPVRMAGLGLTVNDVRTSISSQNKQASIGAIGSTPGNTNNPIVYSLTTKGRLGNIDEFEDIIVRTSSQGGLVKLKDIAKIEFGAETYLNSANIDGSPAAMMLLTQAVGSNAVDLMGKTKARLAELQKTLPDDMKFVVAYDSTEYVRETIKEIIITLFITFLLVALVCYVFLQNWKVTLVPVLAIPVSLIATFAAMALFGYTINILSLFGLVLVIGTVVDDAIIVVERVLFVKARDKCDVKEATIKAMKDITGPMIATTLVFLAIFVPVTFMDGITGQIYRQFAVTIAVSVVFSLVVAMTLSPALCSLLLSDVKMATKGPLKWFDDGLSKVIEKYVVISVWLAKRKVLTIACFAMLVFFSYFLSKTTPSEFIPDEDQGVVFAAVQLPEGATQVRTQAVMKKLMPEIMKIPGINISMNINGFNLMGGSGENVSSIILPLKPWGERTTKEESLSSIVNRVRGIAAQI